MLDTNSPHAVAYVGDPPFCIVCSTECVFALLSKCLAVIIHCG